MLINHFPKLFHKYILNISNYDDEIEYIIYPNNKIITPKNNRIAHLHIMNLNDFFDIYGNFIDNIIQFYTIYITFISGDIEKIKYNLNNEIQFLKVKNKGYDIGPKIAFLDFLYTNNISCNYILFLHSKSDPKKRHEYFNPLIGSIDIIRKNIKIIENNNDIGCIFPNIYKKESHNVKDYSINNMIYLKELIKLYNLKTNDITDFSEGNCMILKKNVVDFIFKNKTRIFYNLCNDKDSFDENWVRQRFNISSKLLLHHLYNDFKNNPDSYKLNNSNHAIGNNLANPNKDMPDGMFEHVWERLWVNFIYECGMKYFVINNL